MKHGLAFFTAMVFSCAAQGAERQPNPPLVVNGDVALTTIDFEAYLQKVPEKLRAEFRANLERVTATVDSLWVYRMMAKKARDSGLASDPIIAARVAQAQELILAEAYLNEAEKKLAIPDLTARAREVYKSRIEEFKVPGQVHVQHILVAVNDCRNREQALQRATEIRERVASGDEAAFTAEAEKVSDDSSKKRNKGDLGFVSLTSLEAPFAAAVAKMNRQGEISEPVETRFGYHIIRFAGRNPERVRAFDEVKESLIAGERQKIIDAMRTGELNAVRNDPGTHVHIENVQALVTDPKQRPGAAASVEKPR